MGLRCVTTVLLAQKIFIALRMKLPRHAMKAEILQPTNPRLQTKTVQKLQSMLPPCRGRTPILGNLHLAQGRVTRILHVLARPRGPGADPTAPGDVALEDKVVRVGEVVRVLELPCEFLRHLEHGIVARVPLGLVKVHGEAEVQCEGYAVVVDA